MRMLLKFYSKSTFAVFEYVAYNFHCVTRRSFFSFAIFKWQRSALGPFGVTADRTSWQFGELNVRCDLSRSFRIISLVSRSPRARWIIYYMVPQRVQRLSAATRVITNNKSLPALVPTGNVSRRAGYLHGPWHMLNNGGASCWRVLTFTKYDLERIIYIDTLLKRHYLEIEIRKRNKYM